MNYYTYRHIRLDTNTPFYVGKGSDKRAQSKKDRNKYWHNIVNKANYRIEIIVNNLSEIDALNKEIELIKLYKSFGYCEANIIIGGKGSNGFTHSFDAKVKISKASLGNNRAGLKVYCSITGQEWTSVTKAAKDYSISREHLSKMLNGKKPNTTNLRKVTCHSKEL